MKGLKWNISRDGDRLVLAGELTESTDLGAILNETLSPPLVVDLGGVERINSCGLRAWIRLVIDLNAAGVPLILERCSPPVVGQLNLISNFVGKEGEVRSVFAPFDCSSCDQEHLELVHRHPDTPVPRNIPCPSCGGSAEFSDLPDLYFSFWGER